MPSTNYPTSIRLSRELKQDLRRSGDRRGWALAKVIQYALKKFADWDKKQKNK